MPLEVIYVTRHGFRSNWLVDPASGEYHSHLKSPTGIAADPALTAHGVDQAKELGVHLMGVEPPVERIFSSPYYRCLQTVQPFVDLLAESAEKPHAAAPAPATATATAAAEPTILGETGLGEWYGAAPFEHPTSAPPEQLKALFPAYDSTYVPAVRPSRMGETIAQLHDRVALTLDAIVRRCDETGVRAVLLCSHAATIIAIGRVLTGCMPENVETEDFRVFTCGLSMFRRRTPEAGHGRNLTSQSATAPFQGSLDGGQGGPLMWKAGRGVGGGWTCEVNSDCSFLSGGEERGWRFSGDEAFVGDQRDATQHDAGVGLGVAVEGKKKATRL